MKIKRSWNPVFCKKDHSGHSMRLWYFSTSVNSFSNTHAQPSSGDRCLSLSIPYFICANSDHSGESVQMRRLAWAFAGRLCDKYHNLMSWLIFERLGMETVSLDTPKLCCVWDGGSFNQHFVSTLWSWIHLSRLMWKWYLPCYVDSAG